MKVIPVIDLLNGIVVHAIRGRRKEYQPIKSVLCSSAKPLDVALAFKACGFNELYVADLDSILGQGRNLLLVNQIVERTGLKVMVDAGISDLEKAKGAFGYGASKIIVGTETLQNLTFVKEAVDNFGTEKVVVSLDLMNGKILSNIKHKKSLTALLLAQKLQNQGASQMIVLDLARVGSGAGVDLALLKQMLDDLNMRVLVGGGVRDIADLKMLRDMGVYGALIATALHSGKILVEDLWSAGLLTS